MNDFKKPILPPPTIFILSFITGITFDIFLNRNFEPSTFQLISGSIVIFSGLMINYFSFREIKNGGTTFNPYSESTELVTSGIYKYSRNPAYFGLAVIHSGFFIIYNSFFVFLSLLFSIIITNYFVIKREEIKMLNTFGSEYDNFRKKVRRWI